MGTDIHAFIEVDCSSGDRPFESSYEIMSCTYGEFALPQNYRLFDALGDGRSYQFPDDNSRKRAKVPPRGIPLPLSRLVLNRYAHIIVNEKMDATEITRSLNGLIPELRAVTETEAEKWVMDGVSEFIDDVEHRIFSEGKVSSRRVSNPDWHTASWLTLPEIEESLEYFDLALNRVDCKDDLFAFTIVVDTMRYIEKSRGEGRTRLVFWFDN